MNTDADRLEADAGMFELSGRGLSGHPRDHERLEEYRARLLAMREDLFRHRRFSRAIQDDKAAYLVTSAITRAWELRKKVEQKLAEMDGAK